MGNKNLMSLVTSTICLAVALIPIACNLEEVAGKNVFSCDARSVADICIQEPASLNTQQASKSTCNSAGGTWSDGKSCPSGYEKKCSDGIKIQYFYAKDDAEKSCTQLVGKRIIQKTQY